MANTAEGKKGANHGPAVRDQDGAFIPLAWEVRGHWGDLAAAFFKKVAKYLGGLSRPSAVPPRSRLALSGCGVSL